MSIDRETTVLVDVGDLIARRAFERRVSAKARRFELGPLVRLLEERGYDRDEIMFVGHEGGGGSAALIHAVNFFERPRRVEIVVNLGLLGGQGLLPSYFQQVVEGLPDPEVFHRFVGFFDHRLISGLVEALYPERDRRLYEDFDRVRAYYFRMLGVPSVSTLQWLWQLYFPEVSVQVERRAFKSSTESHAFRTGFTTLDGSGIIGKSYDSAPTGFAVEVFADEEAHPSGVAWPHVVKRRLEERLFPLLAPFGVWISVALTVRPHATWAKLERQGFLGYERLQGMEEQGHRIVVFSGVAGREGHAHRLG